MIWVYTQRTAMRIRVELQALIEEVVVPESWFFRDERPFQWLREHRSRAAGSNSLVRVRRSGF